MDPQEKPNEVSMPVVIAIIVVIGLILAFIFSQPQGRTPEEESSDQAKMKAMQNTLSSKAKGQSPMDHDHSPGSPLEGQQGTPLEGGAKGTPLQPSPQ